ncbi:MAG: hypothetical protein ACRYF3_10940 [Janthinobacterium lividum]
MVLTLVVTFAVVVGLAVLILLSVAAPPMRKRGSRLIARLDAWAGRALPVVRHQRDRARARVEEAVAERLEAHRQASADKRGTVQQH